MNRKTWLVSALFFLLVMFVAPVKAEAGLVKTGSYTYCYNSDGSIHTGWYKSGSSLYYMDKNGRMLTSKWISYQGNRYYARKNGKLYRNCRVKIGSYYYGFDKNGVMLRGKTTLGGKTYYFYKKNGRMLRKVFVKINDKKYYFGSDGVMGRKVWVKNYYVNASGYVATNTWVGSRYVGADGHPLTGLKELNGVYYYFSTSTSKKLTNTTKAVDGIKYSFDSTGKGTADTQINETEKPSVSVQSTYYTDPVVEEEVLLSAIIYCEAGNQPYYGQLGVGMVITNRMRSSSFPSKLKEVVYQTVQFSPTFDGALTRALKNQSLITDSCKKAAKEIMSKYKAGNYSITAEGKVLNLKSYLFFMTEGAYQRLNLASSYKKLGDHVFFKKWQYA
ncbi:MAG: cell wall hydrolase [Lachnospiraceae bacterium]|nr:cell wall hydrolase [Lachnospiraceae bacterium]